MNIQCNYDKLVGIHKLVEHPQNPNYHSPEQIERLAKIIDYQGQRSPIVVCNKTGFVICGHGRLKAMEKLGWPRVAVNYQEFKDDAQRYAHMTADNAIAEWADLDLSSINNSLEGLGPELDVEMLGLKDFVIEPLEKFDLDEDENDGNKEKIFMVEITFPNETEMMNVYNDILAKGYIAKIK